MASRYSDLAPNVRDLAYRFEDSAFGYMNLDGVDNARDLGGMPTEDGRVIAPGRLLRSGKLAYATEGDIALFKALQLTCVIDFRMEVEREKAPDPFDKLPETSFETIPVVNPGGGGTGVSPGNSLRSVLKEANGSTDSAEKFVHELYRALFLSEAGITGYAEFFSLILTFAKAHPTDAILWHCSAGKDRTGAAAFLLETALGVPREVALADYMASNLFTTTLVSRAMDDLSDLTHNGNVEELVHMYYGVSRENLTLALAAVEKKFSSLDSYLEKELGMTAQKREELQSLFLKPVAKS